MLACFRTLRRFVKSKQKPPRNLYRQKGVRYLFGRIGNFLAGIRPIFGSADVHVQLLSPTAEIL
ncbi:hypothetical protein RBSH_00403 [Rhodopirellula baltica SH28]|uniref:Uncharacterized protein n=1 Tax=Rhodopirellula baltica SH28 TaxID=993517 RepID=K5DP08_RHOBT|nr:hypothetical protein RBSH_00403 [Rhodopirellula baltica SH28]